MLVNPLVSSSFIKLSIFEVNVSVVKLLSGAWITELLGVVLGVLE